nr:PilC/PilY family type IV pilus protein [uncultured Rhodoferax sp.]
MSAFFRVVHVTLYKAATLMCLSLMLSLHIPALAIDLADSPLFSTVKVPGNLALALSVEFPTALAPAYTSAYSASTTYMGYFNSSLCYDYVYNSTSPESSYFYPAAIASSNTCSGKWSGNYMNWASMHMVDEFRSIMTGGYRSTDTNTATNTSSVHLGTILTRTYVSEQSLSSRDTNGTGGNFSKNTPNKSITSGVSSATPMSWSALYTRTYGTGTAMLFTGSNVTTSGATGYNANYNYFANYYNYAGLTTSTASLGGAYTDYQSSITPSSTTVYRVFINVAVCVNASYKEDNCVLYGSGYKPEGLMQSYATSLRYGAFGYLNIPSWDTSASASSLYTIDGGVMRARMSYVGPEQPVPGSANVTNSNAEYSASTGIMVTNPQPSDATATYTDFGVTVSNSGVMNYLNKFGYTGKTYKTFDPVSELYYAAIRHYKGLSSVPEYSSSLTSSTASYADGFPVIKDWSKDPIVYSCQKNFILGIGDTKTNRDTNLYGTTLKTTGNEPSMPTTVSSDTSVNVATATNMIGQMEGNANLGSLNVGTGSSTNSYYIAGLAYDAHTVDMRSTTSSTSSDTNMTGNQTVNTYWVDVLEGATYYHKNQYWMAAKYGGFTVPSSFSPYSSSNGTSTLPSSTWYTNTDTSNVSGISTVSTLPGFSYDSGSYDYRPDNYFFGNTPSTLKSSLTSAFAKISSELGSANSSTYAMASPNVNSGDAAYSATYDPSNWTSNLVARPVEYSSAGVASTIETRGWSGRDLLEARSTPATSRYIVSYCDSASTPSGIQFTSTALAACPAAGRLNYASFADISGATSTSSTPQADYVSYLRGSRTNELSSSTSSTRIYRKRSYLLGDISGSKVTAVGAPSMSYYDIYNPGYSSFKRTYAQRKTVVYAGANDGMLHAFDGTLPDYKTVTSTSASATSTTVTTDTGCTYSTCGKELFAYIPSFVYGTTSTASTTGLASYGSPTRSHYNMVDATPLSFDVDLSNVCSSTTTSRTSACSKVSTTPDWRTLLIGGLGKGGKGFYAIDVTNPGSLTTTSTTVADTSTTTKTVTKTTTTGDWTSESAMASKILWEFPKSTDTTTIARMGYSYGAPTVVKTKKYGWVVIFTSGYNNTDGKAYFFFVNPSTGALLETVATSTGSTTSPLNLAHADAYIPNKADFTADAMYGGDLQGNLWRLDLTPTTGAYSAPTKLATLYKTSGTPQPVTSRPLIEIHPSTSKRYILIGTGRLLADSDTSSKAVQSVYSIYDGTSGYGAFQAASTYDTPLTRGTLEANTNMLNGIGSAPSVATGWYFDLSVDSSSPYYAERVNVDPVAYSGVAAFGVNLPNGTVCAPSGQGYILGFDISTGKSVLQDSAGTYIAKSSSTSGIITDLAIQNVNGKVRLIGGDASGSTVTVPTNISTSSGLKRLSWRNIVAQ